MNPPVIVCGLGHVGWRVLEYLQAAGFTVVAIDLHVRPSDPRLVNVRLIQGDCRDKQVLQQAGLAEARGVLILTSDDLVNVSAALMVRHLDPNVRVVVRMFNQNLIPRLGKAIRNVFALSVSALTAPLVALCALTGDALGTFGQGDLRRQVAELTVGPLSHLRGQTIGELASLHEVQVLAHLPVRGPDRVLLQVDADTRMHPGDRVILCGEPRRLGRILAQVKEETLPHLRWASWVRRNGRMIYGTLAEVDLSVKASTSVLLTVVIVSTVVYAYGAGMTTPEGLYRTISVIATGGELQGEKDFHNEGWGMVFVSILRIAGAALTAAFTAIVTNYLLRARLGGVLEVRRIPDGGHVVICGLGNVGFRVLEELLRYGERVVAIEQSRDSRFLATARRLGVPVVLGDATVLEVLRQAHAATARAVVAATSNELANLEVALLVRELNPTQRVVVRLADPHLAQTFREGANVRLTLSVPTLAAPAFVAALYGDRVLTMFLIADKLLAVVDLVVQPTDPYLSGQSVRAVAMDYRLFPITLQRADLTIAKDLMNHRLAGGDCLTAIADLPDLERLLRRERVPAIWAVDLTQVPPPARPKLVEWVMVRRGGTPEECEQLLNQVPVAIATGLTRGQAEDVLADVRKLGGTGQLRESDGRQ